MLLYRSEYGCSSCCGNEEQVRSFVDRYFGDCNANNTRRAATVQAKDVCILLTDKFEFLHLLD